MNLPKIFFVLLILSSFFENSFGQEKPEARRIDKMEEICSEDLMARMDNYFNQLNDEPTAKGYIIFYGDSSREGRNLHLIKYMIESYPTRRFDKTRLVLLRGENLTQTRTEFWIVPTAAVPPRPETQFAGVKYASTVYSIRLGRILISLMENATYTLTAFMIWAVTSALTEMNLRKFCFQTLR